VVAAFITEKDMDTTDVMLKRLDKVAFNQYAKNVTRWHDEDPGEVLYVKENGRNIDIYIKSVHPLKQGDKIAGKWGNKSIITKIIPDAEAPRTKDGTVIQVLLSPEGVPGRMNIGQIHETAASRIAEKTGKPYIVDNFANPEENTSERLVKEMKALNIEPDETLYDGITGKPIKNKIFHGKMHILKLRHM
jgi:DNA-directed RNA polymerase subunit beta